MAINPTPENLRRFTALYIANGFNAVKAAKAMGMKPKAAKSNAHAYRKLISVPLADCLRAIGLDELSQAEKLKQLRSMKLVKWNPGEEQWDAFEDGHLQLDATKEINRILGAYPAEAPPVAPLTVNVIVDLDL